MNQDSQHSLRQEAGNLCFLKRNLADVLTISRVLIGLIVLSLSFIGKSAYLTVIILALVGAATDILDGKVARHYFGENREGRLGKHDVEVDTLFVLCVFGYFSFSGVVIHRAIGLGWIGLVLIVTIIAALRSWRGSGAVIMPSVQAKVPPALYLYKKPLKVLVISEVITVITLLVIVLLYDPLVFGLIVAPAIAGGIIINRRRVLYLVFNYWPSLFSK